MFGRLVLVVFALAFSLVGMNAQDLGGDFGISFDSSSYTFNGSNGCSLGFCDSGFTVNDGSAWNGGSAWAGGFSPSQLQSLGPSFLDQLNSIQAGFQQTLSNAAQGVGQALGLPPDAISDAAASLGKNVAIPLLGAAFPNEQLVADLAGLVTSTGDTLGAAQDQDPMKTLNTGLQLGAALFGGAEIGAFSLPASVAIGISEAALRLSGVSQGQVDLIEDAATQGALNTLAANPPGLANAIVDLLAGTGQTQIQVFQAPAAGVNTINDVTFGGGASGHYNGLDANGNYINFNSQYGVNSDSGLQNLLLLSQFMSSLGPHTVPQIPLGRSSPPSSGICPGGYVPNPSAFADLSAGFAPGANEYLCEPASSGQSASLGTKVPTTSNVKSASQGTSAPAAPQTATSTPPQGSSGSGLCPNPAANVSNPHGVTPVSGPGVPSGAVTGPNAPGSSYVPPFIPCSQVKPSSIAAKPKAVIGARPVTVAHVGGAQFLSGQRSSTPSPAPATATQSGGQSKKPVGSTLGQQALLQRSAGTPISTTPSALARGGLPGASLGTKKRSAASSELAPQSIAATDSVSTAAVPTAKPAHTTYVTSQSTVGPTHIEPTYPHLDPTKIVSPPVNMARPHLEPTNPVAMTTYAPTHIEPTYPHLEPIRIPPPPVMTLPHLEPIKPVAMTTYAPTYVEPTYPHLEPIRIAPAPVNMTLPHLEPIKPAATTMYSVPEHINAPPVWVAPAHTLPPTHHK